MATAAVALSLVLGGCGGGSDNDVMDPPLPPPEPMPESVSGMVELSAAAQRRLENVLGLNEAGDSDTLTIPPGRTATRAAADSMSLGVVFTCQSMYPCTVTVTNSLGTIEATWETMMLPGGDAAMVTASAPVPPDTFARLNPANAATVGGIILNGLNAPADADGADDTAGNADDRPQRGAYANATAGNQTMVGGLGLGQAGPMSFDDVTLRSSLNPNATAFTPDDPSTAGTDETAGGSTMMGRVPTMGDPSGDEVMANAHLMRLERVVEVDAATVTAEPLAGWSHKVLFRDCANSCRT